MMGLFSSAIVAVCLGATGSAHEACLKGLDAGTRQVGWRQNVDSAEEKTVAYAGVVAQDELGDRNIKSLGTAIYMFKVARDKRMSFHLPTFGLCSSARNEVGLSSYSLSLNWNF